MKIRIKYFEGATKLEKIRKGDWIDVYSREDKPIDIGCVTTIRLGFAMELPEGYEAHLLPRSSTFNKWNIVMTNSMGIIDNSYCGDNDEWCMQVVAFSDTFIHKGDKIGQFRIMETMPSIEFEEVESLGNEDRGGYGSTGDRKVGEING